MYQNRIKENGARYWVLIILAIYHLIAIVGGYFTFTIDGLIVAIVTYYVTGMGITVGFHRYFTHGGFKTFRIMRYLIAIIGGLAGEGHCLQWCAVHREHHKYSDQDGDPHSPLHGFSWAHMLWLMIPFYGEEGKEYYKQYVPDLWEERGLRWISKTYFLQHGVLAGLLFYGGYLYGGIDHAWSWLIWAYFVRMCFLLHATWLVNSASHVWGYRLYDTTDQSRNCWWVALLSFGEGWHNNHHGQPTATNHARAWWEYLYDPSYWIIWLPGKLGLFWDIKTAPKPEKK